MTVPLLRAIAAVLLAIAVAGIGLVAAITFPGLLESFWCSRWRCSC